MKKIFVLFLIIAAVITSCHKDDDDSNDGNFVGTWKIAGGDTSKYYTYEDDGYYYAWHYEKNSPKVDSRGIWEYHPNNNGDFIGFILREAASTSSPKNKITTGFWIISANNKSFIASTSPTAESPNKYQRIENTPKISTSTSSSDEPVYVEDEETEIKVVLSKTSQNGAYTCTVNITGAESSDVEEIGIKFGPLNSTDTPNLLFAEPGKKTTYYSVTKTPAISEKIIAYAIIDGRYYKSEEQTLTATTIQKTITK